MSWPFLHRKRFLFIFLFCFALAVFAYIRKEVFFQQAKKLIKQNLEKNLPGKFSIGNIRAGLFYGLVLENLEISFSQISGPLLDIKVAQAQINYNLWQNKPKEIQRLRLISPQINLSYSPISSPQALPSMPVQKFTREDFIFILENGQISFGKNYPLLKNLAGRILLTQNGLYFQDINANFNGKAQNRLSIFGELDEEHLSLTCDIKHLKIKTFDILTNIGLTLHKRLDTQDNTTKFSGHLKTYGSVLNNQPFPELNSSFEIQDGKLRILTCSLGEEYDLRGIVNLSVPLEADLSLNFYQAAPDRLVAQFSFPQRAEFSGLINGLIKITGELSRPKVEGYLEARDGRIGELSFVSADIHLKGRYPKITIVDSQICREEDSFIVEGEMDFSSLFSSSYAEKTLARQNLLDIRFKADKGLLWQGWDITRKRDNQMRLSKNIADDVKVTFNTFADDAQGDNNNYTNELGLEYKVFADNLLTLRLKREEEILGLERRVKF